MTTSIDFLTEDVIETQEIDYDKLEETVTDLSVSIDLRIKALEEFYKLKENDAVELVSRLNGMYQLSGIKKLEDFLFQICLKANISSFLKLETAKAMIEFGQSPRAAEALNHVCSDLTNMPTPCRAEAISSLMAHQEYKDNANKYFKELIVDQNIECEFRYKTILSLENLGTSHMQEKLYDLCDNEKFVSDLFETFKHDITKEFPDFKPDPKNTDFIDLLIDRLNYNHANQLFKTHLPDFDIIYDFFIKEAQHHFLFEKQNMTYYKILAGQYLLQHSEEHLEEVENEIYSFATDTELDYDRRADAADVLLNLGSKKMKDNGRQIIMELGREGNTGHTVFDNKQNVHTGKVEESVAEILEFFSSFVPILIVNKSPINFDYVNAQIMDILKKEKDSIRVSENDAQYVCAYCESNIKEALTVDDKHFRSDACVKAYETQDKIQIALNRIHMDRVLYSKYNNTLENILLKVWSYLNEHEHEEEMKKRLLQELEEMSGTCSSGFASRLINVISGFGEFSIRISWEDQVVANFAGRLNAAARRITDADSIFLKNHLYDVVELWLNKPENESTLKELREVYKEKNELITAFLESKESSLIQSVICVNDFADEVISEMTVKSSDWASRQHFGLFLRANVAGIREEMYQEFTEHLDDTSFDLYMRKALMNYEGDV